MANEEHLAILKQGVEVWNRWREDNPSVQPDLSEADLSEEDFSEADLFGVNLNGANLNRANLNKVDLREADLSGADLRAANLREADLFGTDFSGADLSGADLFWADLIGADLHGANLIRADLSGAGLSGADLSEADLSEAEFSGVWIGWTIFADVDLSEVKGLEEVRHDGPSTIGIDTIYRSGGKIPESFLRGAGVPENFIAYVGSLVGQAIEYYSVFISYSSKDEAFAQQLYADLQNNGVRCWYAPEDLKIGERFRVRIDESIRLHDKLLLVLSEASVESDWVEHEVETAMEKEREQEKVVLFPIRIDEAVMVAKAGWAAHVRRTRQIGDFRRWKEHDEYQAGFQRLLRDLKTDQAAPTPAAILSERPGEGAGRAVEERVRLQDVLVRYFNDSELRDLCFELSVEYEELPGEGKRDKARELVAYFERRRPGGVQTLAEYVRGKRPQAFG
ncbi:MAG: toll/interleukin-1 receptor domain-containing protein [Chloroflexi bacterium]|nr:toll/interleukin-1 receptor domain-containing protein [Chloroflexota bacterium]MCI0579163.1 toll/interleukin-1 receptor domain-containing protein [Chloroflexota bacterium]MCI0647944.1 toll/interleukin-1 receptor domain-containing protein [Chloroflexota bacterium]MCI0726454.1 toll/interleukin-1 receptor domain-containing protein [Chloroflexota bacterium]